MNNSNFMLKVFADNNMIDPLLVLYFQTKAELQIAREILATGLRIKCHFEIYKWFDQYGKWQQINPAYSF